jgi:hypothetical protein
MKQHFEKIHEHLEKIGEARYKGIQLYLSPLHKANILFIGINPGAGFFNYKNQNVKRFNPLKKFEYIGQKYYLATQTKKLFKDLNLSYDFSNAVKINHFPFATRNVEDLNAILKKFDSHFKLYYLSKKFVIDTIETVQPKLIICEGKTSFDRLKDMLNAEIIEYNDDSYVAFYNDFVIIGYKRHLSHIKNKLELKSKINSYYKTI